MTKPNERAMIRPSLSPSAEKPERLTVNPPAITRQGCGDAPFLHFAFGILPGTLKTPADQRAVARPG
jgi:hypothetical protein